MNLQDFKDVHRDKSAIEKLSLLTDTMYMIGTYRVNYAQSQNQASREHCLRELEGQRQRAEWLCDEIKTALTAQNADSSAKAAESVAIAANAVVSGENDKMDVE